MEKIFDIIKEKLESPVLTNFFIGVVIFNRKVIYAGFSFGPEDRIGDFYIYNNEKFNNKIELLSYINLNEDPTTISANVWLFPILYAIGITGVLPYIKSFFKAIHDNADVFYEWLRVKLNRLKTVSEEKYNSLNALYMKASKDVENANSERDELNITNIDYKAKNKKLEEEKVVLNTNINTINSDIKKLETNIKEWEPSFAYVFRGIWKMDYKFDAPSTLPSGSEYFKIMNGYEIHVSNKPDGIYRLRAYVDRYQYMIDGINYSDTVHNDKLLDRIKFKKSLFNEKGELDENEYSFCDLFLINENEITGEEVYTDNKGVNNHRVRITIIKIS